MHACIPVRRGQCSNREAWHPGRSATLRGALSRAHKSWCAHSDPPGGAIKERHGIPGVGGCRAAGRPRRRPPRPTPRTAPGSWAASNYNNQVFSCLRSSPVRLPSHGQPRPSCLQHKRLSLRIMQRLLCLAACCVGQCCLALILRGGGPATLSFSPSHFYGKIDIVYLLGHLGFKLQLMPHLLHPQHAAYAAPWICARREGLIRFVVATMQGINESGSRRCAWTTSLAPASPSRSSRRARGRPSCGCSCATRSCSARTLCFRGCGRCALCW
jgi:hypothetical protein